MSNEEIRKEQEKQRNKEKQQGRLMPRKDFHLVQFKMKDHGVFVKHHLGGVNPQTQTNDCDYTPHPDLKNACNELQLYMATRLGMLEGWDFASDTSSRLKDDDSLRQVMEHHKEVVSRMNVNGLTFKGEGETFGVAITGSLKVPKGGSVGMSVPKITFSSDALGYEEDVEEICEKITTEVYNYLILRKKEQTNIEDQEEGFDNVGGVQTSILDNDKSEE